MELRPLDHRGEVGVVARRDFAKPLAAAGEVRARADDLRSLTALERGLGFVLSKQGADGLWRDFVTPAGEASEWPSGFIAATLRNAGADAGALEQCAGALVARQNADGGWGYNEDVPTDADSTACVLLFLAGLGGHEAACRRAASCLAEHQLPGGGVATYREAGPIRRYMGVGRWMRFDGWCRPHTEVTAIAGRALAGFDRDAAAAAWDYVRAQQRSDGCWSAYWWTTPHYATLQAVELALVMGEPDRLAHASEWTLESPDPAAPAFATALSLSILLHAGVDGTAVDQGVSLLCALQDDDGGWPSHPIMRIPLPGAVDPDKRRRFRLGGRGLVVADQHRTFTSAVCAGALAQALDGH
jgi:squalene cyclase